MRKTLKRLVELITTMWEIRLGAGGGELGGDSRIAGRSVDLTTVLPLSHLFPAVDSLGISDELKDKLEDVLIPEQQFTLGRMLGKGVGALQGLA